MREKDEETETRRPGANCDDVTEAALGAERMIGRMQDIVTEAIQPGADQEEAFNELIGELDPAPEGVALREALGMDEEGSRALPRGEPRRRRAGTEASPDEAPKEYDTWRTGP
jgi:hypothetical protein